MASEPLESERPHRLRANAPTLRVGNLILNMAPSEPAKARGAVSPAVRGALTATVTGFQTLGVDPAGALPPPNSAFAPIKPPDPVPGQTVSHAKQAARHIPAFTPDFLNPLPPNEPTGVRVVSLSPGMCGFGSTERMVVCRRDDGSLAEADQTAIQSFIAGAPTIAYVGERSAVEELWALASSAGGERAAFRVLLRQRCEQGCEERIVLERR